MNALTANDTAPRSFHASAGLSWLRKVTATTPDIAPAIARVGLGAVMFPHGAQKALGWFDGPGLRGTMGFMTTQLGIPSVFVALAIAAELLGSIGLILGVFSRVAAFGVAVTMGVAMLTAHIGNGFFMNWSGAQTGEGFEYHLLAIALAVVVMVKGGGKASGDHRIAKRL